jgi:hypothetical protein
MVVRELMRALSVLTLLFAFPLLRALLSERDDHLHRVAGPRHLHVNGAELGAITSLNTSECAILHGLV